MVQAAVERASLLDLLLRVFYCGLDSWTPTRLKRIGQAMHANLFSLPAHLLTTSAGSVRTDHLVSRSLPADI